MYYGERFNAITHLIGALLSIAGLVILVVNGALQGDAWKVVSFSIYGSMLVLLYLISTLYHSWRGRAKTVLQRLDHLAIYLLIAGSYTPFCLVPLRGGWGWSLFGVNWGLAIIGIVQELWIGHRTRLFSMIIYVVMGWLILIAIGPLASALPLAGTLWLAAGGVLYTVGIIFFINDERWPHAHGIWHLFVLAGSFTQYWCILRYVSPLT